MKDHPTLKVPSNETDYRVGKANDMIREGVKLLVYGGRTRPIDVSKN